MATPIFRVSVLKFGSSNATRYSPGGRNGMMKSPLLEVTTVRVPCSAGEDAVTVTPGSTRSLESTTWPRIAPVGLPCARALPPVRKNAAATINRLLKECSITSSFPPLEARQLVHVVPYLSFAAPAVKSSEVGLYSLRKTHHPAGSGFYFCQEGPQ